LPATKRPPALMFQGTGSDVGKSLLVAGLCRVFKNRGMAVRPFKPQNMSNNAAVTEDGGEIGRAQALQARAAGVPLSVHMNPVLLKPQTDIGAQVVVQGKVEGTARARDYHDLKPKLLARVLESFAIIGEGADLVLIEGAGSPAEVNLRQGDIANMGFAEAADVPVILVADINRGGVIASLVGTHAILGDEERNRVKGFIINKFRGDPELFDDGVRIIEQNTGWKCFGVVPYLDAARRLPDEDAMALDQRGVERSGENDIKIAVPRLSRIANFDDLDPLMAEPDVSVLIVNPGEVIPADADVILIPGSKATLSDLKDLRAQGWDIDILAHHRRGGAVVGICGGYQMLGQRVEDPDGIEGAPGGADGLGLLDVSTVIAGDKSLFEVVGTEARSGRAVTGYEMHIGNTTGPDSQIPWLMLGGTRPDGACSNDGRVKGAYVHGLFASDAFRNGFLGDLRSGRLSETAYETDIEAALDELAEGLVASLDTSALLTLCR
jgi:adenosylcobyric acid synthase